MIQPTPLHESLRRSEERFRLLVEAVKDYAIFMLDPDGYVVSWNAGAQAIKGWSEGEILGHHFSRFYPAEAVARGWPDRELRIAREQGRFVEEGWRVRKNGSTFWAYVVITAIFDHEGVLRGFAKVTRDMTQRQRLEELEAAESRMNEFLAMLSHELRNPLAPIRSAAQLLRLRADPAQVEWAADVIERQTTHLSRLVDDLMDVARITSGRIAMQREPLDLVAVVTRAVEASRPLIDAQGHVLDVAVGGEPLPVEGDATRLAQVVVNLLNNAAKYTPAGGRIDLSAGREGVQAVLRVRDTGIGIEPTLLPRVFELFTQGESSLDRRGGGLGIGLALVRRIVALHGGAVEIRSDGPGRGTEAIVFLPLRPAPAAEAPAPVGRPRRATTPRRILVVDDHQDAAATLAALLTSWGHVVRTATDGPSALAIAAEQPPDLVLLDIGLPGDDGYEVARRLRELPGCRTATLVAVTGYGQEEDRRRSRAAGFERHLVKPVDPAVVAAIVNAKRPV